MRLLVFQHIECEHPGMLRSYLNKGGVEWDAVELEQGEPIPDLDPYEALWVEYFWVVEKGWIVVETVDVHEYDRVTRDSISFE